ncbi:MAG: 30S ribosomal protein S6 [bacterium]|nr:30S ribosomal protein S6 [bacterium]
MPTKNYEAMAIIDPLMPEPELNALVDRLGETITANGGNLLEISRWGRRKMAYEIGRKAEGYYVIYYFTIGENAGAIAQFERVCRYDEHVLRAMVVKVPTKKHGQEVTQLVPAPGYLADFRIEPRAHTYRRRYEREAPPAGEGDKSETAAPESEAPVGPTESAAPQQAEGDTTPPAAE